MQDKETEKMVEGLYWTSYVRRSILSIKKELEVPDAKEWSSSTIRLLLSQVKEVSKEIIAEGVDLETLTGEYYLPEILKEFTQGNDPLSPWQWLLRVRRGLCNLLENSIRRGKEMAWKLRANLVQALSLSSTV